MDHLNLPKLIHQTEHHLYTIPSETTPESKLFHQRDCVENMARNTINFCTFFEDGTFRPETKERFLHRDVDSRLLDFFRVTEMDDDTLNYSNGRLELIKDNYELSRSWLDVTTGLAKFGVSYDPLNEREVLTGIDNLLSIFAGFSPVLRRQFECTQDSLTRSGIFTEGRLRVSKLKVWVEFLSTPTLQVSIIHPDLKSGELVSTYNDITLSFTAIHQDPLNGKQKRRRHRVSLLITTEHHCTKFGADISS